MIADCTRRLGAARGFTILELIVALTIGAIVVLVTRALTERLAESSSFLQRATVRHVRRSTADELLRALVAQIEVARDSAAAAEASFVGDALQAEFTTWSEVPRGWEERCRVQLGLFSSPDGAVLRASSPCFGTIDLDTLAGPSGFVYLLDPGNGGRWIARWGKASYAPVAIGIVSRSDTTVLRIGARG